MCGLVGIAGNLAHKHELMMKRLLILDYFRGTDSTGLGAIRENGSTVLAKAAVNPITFFDMKSFDKALNAFTSKAFIGHNRAATLGKVNDANAHPYQFGDITGAHNGTLDKASWDRLETESGEFTDTDSAAVFACINAIGIDDTIKLMETGKLPSTGAWALTWYDKRTNTLNFLKNDHRPLWYGFNDDCTEIYWASEWPMLNAMAQMTKNEHWNDWHRDSEGYTFFPFAKDHLYSIDLKKLSDGLSKKDIKAFKGRKIEGREPAPFVPKTMGATRGTNGVPWEKSGGKKPYNKNTDHLDDDISDFVNKKNVQVLTQDRDKDPLNGFITVERFDEINRYGCSFCSQDIDINDTGYTIHEQESCILCPSCSKNGDTSDVKLYLTVQ